MIMKKYFLIVALAFACQINLLAQGSEGIKKDSLLIESLQKKLPLLRDTARINCLNRLAKAFLDRGGYNLKGKIDSANSYAVMANREAAESGYQYGIAYSLVNFGSICRFSFYENRRNRIDNTANLNKWATYQEQLFKLSQQINDAELWGQTYFPMYVALLRLQNRYKEELTAGENALEWFKKSGNEIKESEVAEYIYTQYAMNGEYEKAFDYCNRSLQLAKKINGTADADDPSNELIQLGLANMADIYKTAGDYETALNFLRESRQFHATHNASNTWGMEAELADMFLKSAQYDSAFYYLKPLFNNNNNAIIFQWPILADAYFMTGKYDSALKYYNKSIDSLKPRVEVGVNPFVLVRNYYGKAKVLGIRHDYHDALDYAKKSYTYAMQTRDKSLMLDNYDLLSQCFHQLGENDSAYLYLQKYIMLKDSIITRQFFWRLNNYKKAAENEKKKAEIGLLNKDIKIKSQQLKQETQQKYFLLILLSALILAGIFVYRSIALKRKNDKAALENALAVQQLENEKKHAELLRRTSELEMQALRAQMNPHFIFNCLSSINRFILKNETEAASDYLTRFSRLIRMVLVHSQEPLITLEDELEILRLYLDMEQLRFKDAFDYSIIFTNRVDTGSVFIPSLLLQPFCENAIWHGLMHKEKKGNLQVALSMEDQVLHCTITDDGIGRKMSAEMNSKSTEKNKSLGLKITRERLALLNGEKGITTSYEISDIQDEEGNVAGTRVDLRIRYKESAENVI